MRAREFIKNQINLVFTPQKMSAVQLKEYFITRSRLYKLDEDQYVYYPSRAWSNFNGPTKIRLFETKEYQEIESFINTIQTLDYKTKINIGDMFLVLSFEIMFAWREILLSGFIKPKKVVDIKLRPDNSINYILFDDGDRFPRQPPIVNNNNTPVDYSAYFTTANEASQALTMLSLQVPAGWELIKENFNTILAEGGNVFAGRTSGIAKENIAPTLERYFQELQQIFPQKAGIFNTKYFQPLGSVGKKPISGDIDLGVDISHIIDQTFSDQSIAAWGLDPESVRSEAKVLQSRARTATPEQIMLKAFLKKLTLYINSHAPNLYCDEKKVTAGNIFGLYPQFDAQGQSLGTGVQIDWMIGNINWLHFSYYSSAYPEGSNVKGLHRTQLMLATFGQAGYTFNHVSGVKDKSTNEIVATDPATALKILSDSYGVAFTPDIVENYYKLHAVLKTLPKDTYNAIIDSYLRILDSTRADIPDDLQQYWVASQQRLGLTGKFLPPESKLYPYRSENV